MEENGIGEVDGALRRGGEFASSTAFDVERFVGRFSRERDINGRIDEWEWGNGEEEWSNGVIRSGWSEGDGEEGWSDGVIRLGWS